MKRSTNPHAHACSTFGVTPRSSRMLTADDVADALKISRRQVYREVQRGTLPKPVHFGQRCSRWPAESLEEFLASKANESSSNVRHR